MAGLLIVLMGLFMLGWWSMPALQRDWAPGANARGRTPHSGLFAGHRLCRRLDALHRPDTRSHTGAQFHPRQRRNGHVVPSGVFARPGTPVSRNRAVHRAFSQASARIQPLEQAAKGTGGPCADHHGHNGADRPDDLVRHLDAVDLSRVGKAWLVSQVGWKPVEPCCAFPGLTISTSASYREKEQPTAP